MVSGRLLLMWVLSMVGVVSGDKGPPVDPDPNRLAQEIKTFGEWDSKNAIPAEPVLFVGSSSIRMWRTRVCFPELPVVNRGFGGSHISDVIQFADQVVLPYRAKLIVFYAGDNDIAAGKSAQRVLDDYCKFVGLVHARQPAARILFISIKPSRARWSLWPEMRKANDLIRDFCRTNDRLTFADLATPLLELDGTPDSDLFLKDQLHLDIEGYAVWTKALAPVLKKVLASPKP